MVGVLGTVAIAALAHDEVDDEEDDEENVDWWDKIDEWWVALASTATVATVQFDGDEEDEVEEEEAPSIEDVQVVSNFRPPFTLMLLVPFDSFLTIEDDEVQESAADTGDTKEEEDVRRCPLLLAAW